MALYVVGLDGLQAVAYMSKRAPQADNSIIY
jgi:hypothetical protein